MGSWFQLDFQWRRFNSAYCICFSASTIAYNRFVTETCPTPTILAQSWCTHARSTFTIMARLRGKEIYTQRGIPNFSLVTNSKLRFLSVRLQLSPLSFFVRPLSFIFITYFKNFKQTWRYNTLCLCKLILYFMLIFWGIGFTLKLTGIFHAGNMIFFLFSHTHYDFK